MKKPRKALMDAAVRAMQLLCGSADKVHIRAEQRLHDRATKAVAKVHDESRRLGYDNSFSDLWKQTESEARKRGCKLAMPGKDI